MTWAERWIPSCCGRLQSVAKTLWRQWPRRLATPLRDKRVELLVLVAAFHPRALEVFSGVHRLDANIDAALLRLSDRAVHSDGLHDLFHLPANAARIALLGLAVELLDPVSPEPDAETWQEHLSRGSLPMALRLGVTGPFVPAMSLLSAQAPSELAANLECSDALQVMVLGGLVNDGEAFERLATHWLVVRRQCTHSVQPVGHKMGAALRALRGSVAAWLGLKRAAVVWGMPVPQLTRVEVRKLGQRAEASLPPDAVYRPTDPNQAGFDLLFFVGERGVVAAQVKTTLFESESPRELDALALVQAARKTATFLRPLRQLGLEAGLLVVSKQAVQGSSDALVSGEQLPPAASDADWELLLHGNDLVVGPRSPLRTKAEDETDARRGMPESAGAAPGAAVAGGAAAGIAGMQGVGHEVRGKTRRGGEAVSARTLGAGDVLRRNETCELLRATRVLPRSQLQACLGPSLSLLIGSELFAARDAVT